ncbi:MAG: aminopeptidase P family protein [Acidobacteria bacterium]|nr:aminopeptidase P family protein [Acidobacteriota bacterium]
MDYSGRLRVCRAALSRSGLDVALISHLPNIRYLTGFTGSNGLLLLSADRDLFLTDPRYALQAARQVNGSISVVEGPLEQAAVVEVGRMSVSRVGFESARVSHKIARFLDQSAGPATKWIATENLIEEIRIAKAPDEVAILRRAIELTSAVFDEFVTEIRPGRPERELASLLEWKLRQAGAAKLSFETIIASGPRAALPHGIASDRVLEPGEFVVCDFGIVLDGYCSDITRTVFLGKPDDRARGVYAAVLEAQSRCEAALCAGISCHAADALARDVIASRGYGEYYQHSTGHGIGLEVHEAPRLGKNASGIIPPGAVVTVEPGVYIPDWGGVRIENMVLVREGGVEVLTPGTKDLIELPV